MGAMATCCAWVVVLWLCTAHVGAQLSPVVQGLVDMIEANWDPTADPCSDFFQFSCGAYVAKNSFPPNLTTPAAIIEGIFEVVALNDAILQKIVTDPWPIINDMYQSCMQPSLAEDSLRFFEMMRNQIGKFDTLESLFAFLFGHGVNAFVRVQATMDEYQQMSLLVELSGTTLSNYSDPNAVVNLEQEIASIFSTFEDPATAKTDATEVVFVEEWLMSSNYSDLPQNMTIAELSQLTSIDFLQLMETLEINAQNSTNLTVINANYFKSFQDLDKLLTPNAIEKYIFWRVYQWMASVNVSSCWGVPVPSVFCQNIMKISPTPPPNPPWEQSYVCRSYVHNVLTDYVGLIFTYQNMNAYVSESVRNMTNQIHQAFNNSLPSLSWLDEVSLNNVRFKLSEIIQIIGHSEIMDRYENVTTSPSTYYNNLWEITAATVRFKNTFASSPFNRSDFDFDPMLVNAFYNPPTNSINFPAGFLESPLYSASWPKLFQYGILGFVVGHETTHGFDNYGSYWNAFGLPGDILDQTTRDNFNKNAQCIADYYGDFVVFGNTTMNGTSTLGENIADIGGLKNLYRAYQD